MIAVMLQARRAAEQLAQHRGARRYNNYIGEVARLTDRVLRTIPDRAARGDRRLLDGWLRRDERGARRNLRDYSVVESWEGYFDNLSGRLAADRRLLARLPLHAFVYGGRQDTVASARRERAVGGGAARGRGAGAERRSTPARHASRRSSSTSRRRSAFAGRALRG